MTLSWRHQWMKWKSCCFSSSECLSPACGIPLLYPSVRLVAAHTAFSAFFDIAMRQSSSSASVDAAMTCKWHKGLWEMQEICMRIVGSWYAVVCSTIKPQTTADMPQAESTSLTVRPVLCHTTCSLLF